MRRAAFWCLTLVLRAALRALNWGLRLHRGLAQRWRLPYRW